MIDKYKKGMNPNSRNGFKKGYKHSEETKQKLRESLKGRKLSEETKNKISKSLKGRETSKEHRNNLSKFLKGLKRTNETKKKTSKGLKKYYKEHPEAIVRLKEARKYQVTPVKDTTIEIKIQNFLKQLGIEFFTHQYMKEIEHSYQCDILIPSYNMVIECDGNYWHNYPIGNDRDHIRTKELLEKGFKVLRLWEYEIRIMDIKQFKNKLLEVKI